MYLSIVQIGAAMGRYYFRTRWAQVMLLIARDCACAFDDVF
jgi:hypothetical protein